MFLLCLYACLAWLYLSKQFVVRVLKFIDIRVQGLGVYGSGFRNPGQTLFQWRRLIPKAPKLEVTLSLRFRALDHTSVLPSGTGRTESASCSSPSDAFQPEALRHVTHFEAWIDGIGIRKCKLKPTEPGILNRIGSLKGQSLHVRLRNRKDWKSGSAERFLFEVEESRAV